jgi:hypothetical protein
MSSSHNRRLATVALIAGVLLTAAGPAQADTVTWSMAPCVTGVDMEPSPRNYAGYVVLEGAATQCGPVTDNGGFRIAAYPANATTGTAPGYNTRLFRSTVVGESRSFGVAALPMISGEYGVCVLAGQDQRLGCYRAVVTTGGGDATAVLRPLATDAALVAKEVVMTPYTGAIIPPRAPGKSNPTNPACGTCF